MVRLPPEKLKVNCLEGIKLIVKTLGGVWGKTVLEDRYEKFERAIYGISQKNDESNESYMSRHEILFEDMLAQGSSINDVRAYCLLRNSALSAEDKKRVLVEAKGNLQYDRVTTAIRMLGAKFFHEVQGQQKQCRGKTYEVNHVQENDDEVFHTEDQSVLYAADSQELTVTMVDQCALDGDEDALVVQQFEEAVIEAVQSDGEMAIFMSTYLDARKRLLEKSRSHGFWPVRGKGFGTKGKSKEMSKGRKPLALRIAESNCRLCGAKGHWKAECPRKLASGNLSSSMSSSTRNPASANVMISEVDLTEDADVFVMEQGVVTPVQPSSHQAGYLHKLKSHSQEIFLCNHLNYNPKSNCHAPKTQQSTFIQQFRQKLSSVLAKYQPPTVHRKPSRESPCETPSPPEGGLSDRFSQNFCVPGGVPLPMHPTVT